MKFVVIPVFTFVLFGAVFAQGKASVPIMPLSEIKPGMKGIAKTVFSGTVPEEFNVEILGIANGFVGPKQDAIIMRLSGGKAERTFVFAGMSGSPVYIDGKLVGAISYSFPFGKEPIGAITPIEQMISIFEKNPDQKLNSKEPRAFSFGELAATELNFNNHKTVSSNSFLPQVAPNSALVPLIGQQISPIATPLVFGGVNRETLNYFTPQLTSLGFMPVSTFGGTSKMTELKANTENSLRGGDSVAMHLTRGDISLTAFGTVTLRDGDKVYAFGHPFLSLGTSDLPMSESSVVTVVPNFNNSFKLGVAGDLVGSMTQDRATGVFGNIGKAPKMIPVNIKLNTSRNQTENFNFEVATDDFLSPILINIGVLNAIQANERGLGDTTISLKGTVNVKGQQPIILDRRFSGNIASAQAAGSVAVPVNLLLDSGFDGIKIDAVNLTVTALDGKKTASLERISVNRTEVKAGETFEVQAFARNDRGQVFVQKIPVKVPNDMPTGMVLLNVGDGNSIQQVATNRLFVPKNVDELIQNINQIKKSDRLYVQLVRVTNGAVIGAKEMPNLPPSVLATLNNDRTAGGFTPTLLSFVTEQEVSPAEFVIAGNQVLSIEVVK